MAKSHGNPPLPGSQPPVKSETGGGLPRADGAEPRPVGSRSAPRHSVDPGWLMGCAALCCLALFSGCDSGNKKEMRRKKEDFLSSYDPKLKTVRDQLIAEARTLEEKTERLQKTKRGFSVEEVKNLAQAKIDELKRQRDELLRRVASVEEVAERGVLLREMNSIHGGGTALRSSREILEEAEASLKAARQTTQFLEEQLGGNPGMKSAPKSQAQTQDSPRPLPNRARVESAAPAIPPALNTERGAFLRTGPGQPVPLPQETGAPAVKLRIEQTRGLPAGVGNVIATLGDGATESWTLKGGAKLPVVGRNGLCGWTWGKEIQDGRWMNPHLRILRNQTVIQNLVAKNPFIENWGFFGADGFTVILKSRAMDGSSVVERYDIASGKKLGSRGDGSLELPAWAKTASDEPSSERLPF